MTRSTSWVALPLAVAGAVAAIACSADTTSVVVSSARAPGDKCDFSDDTKYVDRGSVDLRPFFVVGGTSFTDSYRQIFSWQNNLQATPLVVNGQTVDNGSGNDFIAQEVHFSYKYSDASVTFENEVANISAVITAGGTRDKNSVPADLIQPKAAAKLAQVATATPQTLLVTFFYRGKLSGGGKLDTNSVTFPLTVYKSNTMPLACGPDAGLVTDVCGIVGRDLPVACSG